eukprot:15155946-Alexandrium_andersonii.AAC.1
MGAGLPVYATDDVARRVHARRPSSNGACLRDGHGHALVEHPETLAFCSGEAELGSIATGAVAGLGAV